ncbi:MAG: MBL fold metallo-hydrolase [Gammaproteobacteria bacterium]
MSRLIWVCALALLACGCVTAAPVCVPGDGVTLQVLGSGGPIADDARAATAYVIWIDGRSRLLVDAGSGTFLRMGQAGAAFDDLDFVALSHLHTDHSADLPALLKSGVFSKRSRALGISGPSAGGPFPGLNHFLDRLIGKDGAYAYLSSYLHGTSDSVRLEPVELDVGSKDVMAVYADAASGIRIDALSVPHGIVPAMAYRISIGDQVLVFASDQNGNNEAFADFARDADLLTMHMVVPEGVTGAGRALHAPPALIGKIAADAGVSKLVLSHFMARSLKDLPGNVAAVKKSYGGPVVEASDLACIVP